MSEEEMISEEGFRQSIATLSSIRHEITNHPERYRRQVKEIDKYLAQYGISQRDPLMKDVHYIREAYSLGIGPHEVLRARERQVTSGDEEKLARFFPKIPRKRAGLFGERNY